MVYATLDDLEIYLTADWLNEIDSALRTAQLEDASALIDSYLAQRYKLPIIVANRALVRACCLVARWQLILAKGINQDSNYGLYGEEYRNVLTWLEQVAKGSVTLHDVTDSTPMKMSDEPNAFLSWVSKAKRWG